MTKVLGSKRIFSDITDDECMEFLITNILDRMKNCSKIRRNSFEEDKNNLILEKKIVNESNEEMGKLCC